MSDHRWRPLAGGFYSRGPLGIGRRIPPPSKGADDGTNNQSESDSNANIAGYGSDDSPKHKS
jgi:hypothetical protein